MINIEVKKILHNCTSIVGFVYEKKHLYYTNEDLIIIVEMQKSSYDVDEYYINYGFLIRELHSGLTFPKITDCDCSGRFINNIEEKTEFSFKLSTINSSQLQECFDWNITQNIIPVITYGIRKYFEIYPKALFTAKKCLKEYLKMECQGGGFLDN